MPRVLSQAMLVRLRRMENVKTVNHVLREAALDVPVLTSVDRGIRVKLMRFHLASGWHVRGTQVSAHHHRCLVQIEYVLSGKFTFTLDPQTEELGPGEAVLIPPERPHSWRCTQAGFLLGIELEPLMPAHRLFPPIRTHRMLPLSRLPMVRGLAPHTRVLFHQVLDKPFGLFSAQRLSALITLWLTDMLAGHLKKIKPSGIHAKTAYQDELVSRTLNYLMDHYGEPLSVDQIARQIGVSGRHLMRLFGEAYGETVHRTLQKIRLDIGYEMLRSNPSVGIKQVAFDCGFASATHFSRLFKKRFGIYPSRMR